MSERMDVAAVLTVLDKASREATPLSFALEIDNARESVATMASELAAARERCEANERLRCEVMAQFNAQALELAALNLRASGLSDAVKLLGQQCAALRLDSERLDFISRQRFEVVPIEGGGWDVSALDSEGGHPTLIGSRIDLRAAIDEAMEQTK